MSLKFESSEEVWYSLSEMAEKLGKKPQTLRMWKCKGLHSELKPIKFGGSVYYSSKNLINFLKAQ